MTKTAMNREVFQGDRRGRRFADVWSDAEKPYLDVLAFFDDESRQQRMEDSELHHDRPPLAGVVRELESLPSVDRLLGDENVALGKRFRQAIGVMVRIIMEGRGWAKTGRKGSLGVRPADDGSRGHNTGGLAFWFLRAERYQLKHGMPFRSVRERNRTDAEKAVANEKRSSKRELSKGKR